MRDKKRPEGITIVLWECAQVPLYFCMRQRPPAKQGQWLLWLNQGRKDKILDSSAFSQPVAVKSSGGVSVTLVAENG